MCSCIEFCPIVEAAANEVMAVPSRSLCMISLSSPRHRIVSIRVLEYTRLIGIPKRLYSCVSALVKNRIRVMTAKTPANDPVCTAALINRRMIVSERANPVLDWLRVYRSTPQIIISRAISSPSHAEMYGRIPINCVESLTCHAKAFPLSGGIPDRKEIIGSGRQ